MLLISFKNPIILSTVIGRISQIQMQERMVGLKDGRKHTEPEKSIDLVDQLSRAHSQWVRQKKH